MTKKYYWLKLKEDFFNEKHIKFLRSMPDGDKLVIVYLKLQLKSLRTDGYIKYDKILPNNIDELSLILDEDKNIVSLTIQALLKTKSIEMLDDGSLYMLSLQDLIGKEGASAERVRKFRKKQQEMLQCNNSVLNCNREIEKEIDIEIEKDIKKEKNSKKEKYYGNEELNNLFLEFLELRKKIKAVNSERAINMLIKKLSNYDDNTKKQMIERSILNSWKDVYEIKDEVKKYSNEWWAKV